MFSKTASCPFGVSLRDGKHHVKLSCDVLLYVPTALHQNAKVKKEKKRSKNKNGS
jgi:hypothetical protein